MRIVTVGMLVALIASGCSVNQGMQVVRSARYDAHGNLTGYTVEETLFLPKVRRPIDRAAPVELYETGDTLKRNEAHWPPSGSHRRAVLRR